MTRRLLGRLCLAALAAVSDTEALKAHARRAPSDRSRPRTTLFKNGELGYGAFRIPVLLRVPPSTVLAFAEAREKWSRDFGHIDIALKRSLDNGRTWGPPSIVSTFWTNASRAKDPIACKDPAPVLDRNTGTVILVWSLNNQRVFVQDSEDAGATWGAAREITEQVVRPGWGWIATGPGHALQLRSGRLIIPFNSYLATKEVKIEAKTSGCQIITGGCRYLGKGMGRSSLTTVEVRNPADPSMEPLHATLGSSPSGVSKFVMAANRPGVFFSDDQGKTWQLGGMVNSHLGSSECVAAETQAGLLLSFRTQYRDTGCRKMALSRDSGMTFEHHFEPGRCIPDPNCQGSLLALEDGRLVTSGPGSRRARAFTMLHLSDSNVSSWFKRANGDPGTDVPKAAHARRRRAMNRTHFRNFRRRAKDTWPPRLPDGLPHFKLMAQVSAFGGYSDIVELGPLNVGEATTVGVLHEARESLHWSVVTVPNAAAV